MFQLGYGHELDGARDHDHRHGLPLRLCEQIAHEQHIDAEEDGVCRHPGGPDNAVDEIADEEGLRRPVHESACGETEYRHEPVIDSVQGGLDHPDPEHHREDQQDATADQQHQSGADLPHARILRLGIGGGIAAGLHALADPIVVTGGHARGPRRTTCGLLVDYVSEIPDLHRAAREVVRQIALHDRDQLIRIRVVIAVQSCGDRNSQIPALGEQSVRGQHVGERLGQEYRTEHGHSEHGDDL